MLKDRKILITGASGGIGSAFAKVLAIQGAKLLLVGRNSQKLNTLINQLEGDGHIPLSADLSQTSGRAAMIEEASDFQADTLINALGANQLSLLADTEDEQIEVLIGLNLIAPMAICRDMIPILQRRSAGLIVNVGSILGSIGYAGSSVYCASKFGLRGFSESLRRELSDTAIKVLYFAPRATATSLNTEAMQQMNKELGNREDGADWVATQLLKAITKAKPHTRYLGWPEKFFVRLNSLFPRLVDKALIKQLSIIRRYAKN